MFRICNVMLEVTHECVMLVLNVHTLHGLT